MLKYFYYDETGVCGMKYNGVNYWFKKNILGDIVAVYSAAGVLQGTYTYDAWVNPLSMKNGSGVEVSQSAGDVVAQNPFRYRGYYYDKETGYYYLESRYYDPELGRFINADEPSMLFETADVTFGANLYAYCLNNPVMYTDKNGHLAEIAIPVAGGLAAAGPVGWIILAIVVVAVAIYLTVTYWDDITAFFTSFGVEANSNIISNWLNPVIDKLAPFTKNKPAPLPPGTKGQGLEKGNKSRNDPSWQDRSNSRRPKPPKKHTPGKGHKKYIVGYLMYDQWKKLFY